MTPMPPCDYGHPAQLSDISCPTCDAHRIARIRPGYLDKLHTAARDDQSAARIYQQTIDAIHNTAHRLYWGWHRGESHTGLEQLTLISQGHQLLTAVQGHTPLPEETQDLIHALFTVTAAAGADAGISTPTPTPQLTS